MEVTEEEQQGFTPDPGFEDEWEDRQQGQEEAGSGFTPDPDFENEWRSRQQQQQSQGFTPDPGYEMPSGVRDLSGTPTGSGEDPGFGDRVSNFFRGIAREGGQAFLEKAPKTLATAITSMGQQSGQEWWAEVQNRAEEAGQEPQEWLQENRQEAEGLLPDEDRGFLGTLTGEAPSQETVKSNPLYQFGEWAGRQLEEVFPQNEELKDEFLAGQLPQMIGETAAIYTLGIARGGAAAAQLGSASLAAEEYERAQESGASDEEAFLAWMGSLPVGATEALGIGGFVSKASRLGGIGKKAVVEIVSGGIDEGFQEVGQQAASNFVGQNTYAETRELTDGLGQAFVLGSVAGSALHGVRVGVQKKMMSAETKQEMAEAKEANEEIDRKAEGNVDDIDPGQVPSEITDQWNSLREEARKDVQGEDNDLTGAMNEFNQTARDNGYNPATLSGALERQRLRQEGDQRNFKEQNIKDVSPQQSTLPFGKKMFQKVKRFFHSRAINKGIMPKSAWESRFDMKGRISADLTEMEINVNTLTSEVDRLSDEGNLPFDSKEDAYREVGRVLNGEGPFDERLQRIPETMREPTKQFRRHLDRMSLWIKESGLAPDGVEAKIDADIGAYLTRAYRLFDPDADYNLDQVDPVTLNKGREALRIMNPNATETDIDNTIKEMFNRKTFNPFEGSPKANSLDLSIFKERNEDIDPRIRALWGEYEQGHLAYIKSIQKMANLLHQGEHMQRVRDFGLEEGWLVDPSEGDVPGDYQFIAAEGNERMEPLAGLAGSPEVVGAFEETRNNYREIGWLNTWMRANAAAKFSKTVLNQATQVKNLLGGAIVSARNGLFPKKGEIVWAYSMARLNAGKNIHAKDLEFLEVDKNQLQEDLYQMQRHGLLDKSIKGSEIEDILVDADLDPNVSLMDQLYPSAGSDRGGIFKIGRMVKRSPQTLANIYQGADNIVRLAFYRAEFRRQNAARPEMSEEEVSNLAAEHTKMHYQDYGRVPKWVRSLRRSPFQGTFMSFYSELVRNEWNSWKTTASEVTHENPEVRKIGHKRAAWGALISSGAATAAATLGTRLITNVASETDDLIREFAAPWDKDGAFAYLGKVTDKASFINLSRIDPYAMFSDPARRVWRAARDDSEETYLEAVINGAKKQLEPFYQSELFTQRAIEARTNKKYDGGPVYNPALSTSEKAQRIFLHLLGTFEPGFEVTRRRIFYSFDTPAYPWGSVPEREYDTSDEVLGGFGLRPTTIYFKRSLMHEGINFEEEVENIQTFFSNHAKHAENLSAADRMANLDRTNEMYTESWRKMERKVDTAFKLGLSWNEIQTQLDNANIPKTYQKQLRRGYPGRLRTIEDMLADD